MRATRPNVGIEHAYRDKLLRLVDDMGRSYVHFIRAQYRATPPEMLTQDASPAKELQKALKGLFDRWESNFADAAPKLARWFTRSTTNRCDASLKKILRDAGISVRFQLTAPVRDILDATVTENVSLIKSIPAKFHLEIEGIVMRSVVEGRDLSDLTRELQHRYKLTRSRAELIALDQNNKVTSAIRRAREIDAGIEEGIWLHSHAGREPRPTHLANHGKRFSLVDGWFDPDPKVRKKIWPGQLIRCRCTWKPVVKGFS